jgi:hypothetical protein
MCILEPGFMDPTIDNWELLEISYDGNGLNSGDLLPQAWRRNSMHDGNDAPVYAITLQSPQDAYNLLIVDQHVGCNGRLDENGNFVKNLDRVDSDILGHVLNGSGPSAESELDHQDDFGGYPPVDQGKAYSDIDHDGMPDAWENTKGLNTNLDDSAEHDLSPNYTNIEIFINSIPRAGDWPPAAPAHLRIRSK